MSTEMIGEREFEEKVRRAEGTVLLRFTAENCPHCRALQPRWEKAAKTFGDRAKFYDVNVAECPALTQKFGIRGVPAVLRFDTGRETARALGAIKEAELFGMVQGGTFQL